MNKWKDLICQSYTKTMVNVGQNVAVCGKAIDEDAIAQLAEDKLSGDEMNWEIQLKSLPSLSQATVHKYELKIFGRSV